MGAEEIIGLALELGGLALRAAEAARADNLDEAKSLLAKARDRYAEGIAAWDVADKEPSNG